MKYLIYILTLVIMLMPANSYGARKYVVNVNKCLAEASLNICIAQIGVREIGNNNGIMVRQYLLSVGLGAGNPYCMAGQYWSFNEACKKLNLPTSEIPILRTGSTYYCYNDAQKRGTKVQFKVYVGDLIFWRLRNTLRGHVERVVSIGQKGWLVTVGFNTSSGNSGSQDDGQGVYKRNRNIRHPLGRMALRGLIGFRYE